MTILSLAAAVCAAQVHEPHPVFEVWEQALRGGEGEDGGDAAAKHVLDWGERDQNVDTVVWSLEIQLIIVIIADQVQFLKKALDTLCECRRTLMYTYAFAYYLKKNNQSAIFEDNQRDLETATEQLSEYLERDIDGKSLVDIKQKVQDKHRWFYIFRFARYLSLFRYCESRRKVLLAHVKEGYDKDWWLYIESYWPLILGHTYVSASRLSHCNDIHICLVLTYLLDLETIWHFRH